MRDDYHLEQKSVTRLSILRKKKTSSQLLPALPCQSMGGNLLTRKRSWGSNSQVSIILGRARGGDDESPVKFHLKDSRMKRGGGIKKGRE